MPKNHPKPKLVRSALLDSMAVATKAGAIRSTKTTKTPARCTEDVTVKAKSEKKSSSFKKPDTLG